MRTAVLLFIAIYLCSPDLACAQQPRGSWVRRLTLAASCAASFWDVQTTAAAIARGGRESNGLFTDPQGRPQWGRMVGFKVGICGALAVAQESKLLGHTSRLKNNLWIGANTGLTTRFMISSIRNRSVADELSGTPPMR